ncbi:MAG: LuxR C-terminal-related transcriptional regulator [Chloroflexota bacterium]
MDTPLLQTKLYIPPPHSKLVPRLRLIERLNEGATRNLTLISASAGFGKTTLVSDWVQQTDRPATWLSLDEADNDPIRFFSYFIAALQQITPEAGETAQTLLKSLQFPAPDLLMTTLINDLATMPEFTLILDDYHVIEAEPIDAALTFLLNHLPLTIHLVIITRTDPQLPLFRLRGRAQLVELRADDLRFTREETTTFLNKTLALTLSPEDAAALETRTEGWITGLQLAVHFMQGQTAQASSDFIATFTGDHRYIVDYLGEEVLSQQTEELQTFLLHTSILDRMRADLCDRVTGLKDSQTILESLEQTNLFIVPLDNDRRWYRYQQFFAEFLQGRLRRQQPDLIDTLHERAAHWYKSEAFSEQAIAHFLAAEQFEQAAALMETRVDTTLHGQGQIATFLKWVEALPEDLLLKHPQLELAQVWALLFSGQWSRVEPRLQAIEKSLSIRLDIDSSIQLTKPPTDLQEFHGEVAALRSELALFQMDFLRAIELSEEALRYLSLDNSRIRSTVTQIQGYSYRLNGDVDKARQALSEATQLSKKVGNINTSIFSLSDLAAVQVMQGLPHEAAQTYQQIMNLASEHRAWPFPPTGVAYVGMGNLLREWNDLEMATQHVTKGLELIAPAVYNSVASQAYAILADIRQAQGDADAATAYLQQAAEAAQKSSGHPMNVRIPLLKARLAIRQGAIETAARWANQYQIDRQQPESLLAYQRHFAEITFVRVRLAQGFPDLDLVDQLLQKARTAGWGHTVIELLIMKALSLQVEKKRKQALTTLAEALTLAEPAGYIRLFVDEGPPMVELLRDVLKQGVSSTYVGKLQASFMPTMGESKPSAQTLIDPLTDRELEVLKLMATGLANREIAAELVVALGTVAKYSNNIFTKLNVRNRTEAIARAGALEIL